MRLKGKKWVLVLDDKRLAEYDHPIKAEHAADHYFKVKGIMPEIVELTIVRR